MLDRSYTRMVKFSLKNCFLWAVAIVMLVKSCHVYRELSGLLDEAKALTNDEINALTTLFEVLQVQYDSVTAITPQAGLTAVRQIEQQYKTTLQEFDQQLNNIFPEATGTIYNITLPTVEEIFEKPDFSLMSQQQRIEFLDLQGLLQDTLDEAQTNLNDLAARALNLETNLLKINKPKIAVFIFEALKTVYQQACRVGRAAYCTYSHIPQLNTSLQSFNEGVDCYLFTTSLITKIQTETHQTVKTVKKNIFELAAVYKKVSKQNTLLGKIVLVILNVTSIAKNILDTISTAQSVLDSVENQLPVAAQEVNNCSSNFTLKIPFMIETVTNVTECILFKDDTENNMDFMKSEEEYYKQAYNVAPDNMEE